MLAIIFCFLKINLHVDFEVAKCFGSESLKECLQLRASRFYNYGTHKQSDLESLLPATMHSLEKKGVIYPPGSPKLIIYIKCIELVAGSHFAAG